MVRVRDRGVGGAGGHVPPPQYFKNYKELVRKSVLCTPLPPNLKVAPRSLRVREQHWS